MRIFLAFLMLTLSVLACAGTALSNTASFACPTAVPTVTVIVTPTTTLPPGTPTLIPLPTTIPLPSAVPTATGTPVVIQSPADFYIGDAVIVGVENSADRVSLRIFNVQTYTLPGDQMVVSWQLEVSNLGVNLYEIFPAIQLILSEVDTGLSIESGMWGSVEMAGASIGLELDLDVYTLMPDETQIFTFATFAPLDEAHRFSFLLDPMRTDSPMLTWLNQTNPYCGGGA